MEQTQSVDARISMPPRGDRPGHKIGRNDLRYWIAKQVVRDTKGFPEKCIALPGRAADETEEAWEARIAGLCREHTARLLAHIDDPTASGSSDDNWRRLWDGSIGAVCRIYRTHPHSPFNTTVKKNTKRFYTSYLNLIEDTVGSVLARNTDLHRVRFWYGEWRKPVPGSEDERIDRAHDAVSTLRTALNFCSHLKFPGKQLCKELAADIGGKDVKFEKGGAGEGEMTLAYVRAFTKAALEFGRKSKMPMRRCLSLAIGTVTCFETMLRPMDVIGEWGLRTDKYRIPKGASIINYGPERWHGFYTWENIASWRWRMKTSKSKYRSAADFDLTVYGLLMPLLEAVPLHERRGAVIIDENSLPVRESSHRKWWREIADAAGIPAGVHFVHNRAGGASEADEAGADFGDISLVGLTHGGEKTVSLRYLRRGHTNRRKKIAKLREALRAAEGSEG